MKEAKKLVSGELDTHAVKERKEIEGETFLRIEPRQANMGNKQTDKQDNRRVVGQHTE